MNRGQLVSPRNQRDTHPCQLVVYFDQKSPDLKLVYDLQEGENYIGKNQVKCNIVLNFPSSIDDIHAKINVDYDNDYTIEDMASRYGVYRVSSDSTRIKLKPNRAYDLGIGEEKEFYLNKYRCVFSKKQYNPPTPIRQPSLQQINKKLNISIEDDIVEEDSQLQQFKKIIRDDDSMSLEVYPVKHVQKEKKVEKTKNQKEKASREEKPKKVNSLTDNTKSNGIQEVKTLGKTFKKKNDIGKVDPYGNTLDMQISIQAQESEEELFQPKFQKKVIPKKVERQGYFKECVLNDKVSKNEPTLSQLFRKYDIDPQKEDQMDIEKNQTYKALNSRKEKQVEKYKQKIEEKASNLDQIEEESGSDFDIQNQNEDLTQPDIFKRPRGKKSIAQIKTSSRRSSVTGNSDTDSKKKEFKIIGKRKGKQAQDQSDEDEVLQQQTVKNQVKNSKLTRKIVIKKAGSNKKQQQAPEEFQSLSQQIFRRFKQNEDANKPKRTKKQPEIVKLNESEESDFALVSDEEEIKISNKKKNKKIEEIPKKIEERRKKIEEIPKKIEEKPKKIQQKPIQIEKVQKKPKKVQEKPQKIQEKPKKIQKNEEVVTKPQQKESKLKSKVEQQIEKVEQEIKMLTSKQKTKILFSGNCTITPDEQNILKRLNIQIIDNIHEDFDILVTDLFKRKVKTLLALNRQATIVNQAWVDEMISKRKYINPQDFAINVDTKTQEKLNFDWFDTLKKSQNNMDGIFSKFKFYIPTDAVFTNITREEINILIQTAGGDIIQEIPANPKNIITIVNDDYNQKKKDQLQKLSLKLYSIEVILGSCLRQKADLKTNQII